MMQRHEADGTIDHPEYKGAIDDPQLPPCLPAPGLAGRGQAPRSTTGTWRPTGAIQGPNEFLYVGSIKDWNRVPDLHRITQPALVLCGLHDELTPACSGLIHRALPDSRIHVFPNSSHLPFWEEPDAYFGVLQDFLDHHSG